MSNFDPSIFLDQTTETAAEKRPPLPAGDYQGIITKVDVKPWVSQKDPTKAGNSAFFKIEVQVPPDVQDRLGIDKATLTLSDSAILDISEDGRSLDWSKGKNGGLRRYREALGMNESGRPFSIRMMEGRPLRVKVGHEEYQGAPVERVTGVAGL